MSLFGSLRSRRRRPFDAPIAPDAPFVAIGDVHGRSDLLATITDRLSGAFGAARHIVFVGDYIDRGPDSLQVLRSLAETQQHKPDRLTCLLGNHEDMLLGFLDDPARAGPHWMRYGGLQTIACLSLSAPGETAPAGAWEDLRDTLRQALGPALETWLRRLPTYWTSGNVTVVHAGADPSRAIIDQERKTLLWGHPDFARRPRTDGTWVLHGHTVVEAPDITEGRIAIDTGAYATGCLTAAMVEPGRVQFLST